MIGTIEEEFYQEESLRRGIEEIEETTMVEVLAEGTIEDMIKLMILTRIEGSQEEETEIEAEAEIQDNLHNEGETNRTTDTTINTALTTTDVHRLTQGITKASSVDTGKTTDNLLTYCCSKSPVYDDAEDEDSSQHNFKRKVVIVEQAVGS